MTATKSDYSDSPVGERVEDLAPGANPAEVQAAVPFAMTEPFYIRGERYYDREFFELEKKHVWSKSWLMAARLEEIPNPGDYAEFEVIGNSVLIVRQQDGSVKALHNACRHRATELAKGHGRLPGGQLVCPFHGWRWNLDGSNSFVFMDGSFDPSTLQEDDLKLREAQVEVWAGMVWINLDPEAAPLSESLSPANEIMDSIGIGNMRAKWWKQVILNANWKMCMEAFMESFHTMQTHPQLLLGKGVEGADAMFKTVKYIGLRGGHGRFHTDTAVALPDWSGEDFLEQGRLLASGQDAMTLDRDVQIFEGLRNKMDIEDPSFPMKAIEALYEYAQGAGIPMAPLGEQSKQWGGEVFAFPNYFMLPMYGNCLVYRMRPLDDDPEKTLFDVWSLTTYPEGQEPERIELQGVYDKDDADHWGLIPRQDFGNIERQQRGLHSKSFDKMRVSPEQEAMIINLHQHLDRLIADGERSTP